MKFHFTSSDTGEAPARRDALIKRYGQHDTAACDAVIVLGGDGKMLAALKSGFADGNPASGKGVAPGDKPAAPKPVTPKPVFGMNCGTVGFLMNEYDDADLVERVGKAEPNTIHPLAMHATDTAGKTHTAHAINEVSLWRESEQTARIRIEVDGVRRLDELICDGVLLATPAGSTAYNFSAHGPILPLGSDMLALTPISPFRPRRWRGALLGNKSEAVFEVRDPEFRPVSAAADGMRVSRVAKVSVRQDDSIALTILSDPGHGLAEKAMREQFLL